MRLLPYVQFGVCFHPEGTFKRVYAVFLTSKVEWTSHKPLQPACSPQNPQLVCHCATLSSYSLLVLHQGLSCFLVVGQRFSSHPSS